MIHLMNLAGMEAFRSVKRQNDYRLYPNFYDDDYDVHIVNDQS